MTKEQILEQLNEIFQDVFDDPSIIVTKDTTANDIEEWDSLEHIHLIMAVEKTYGIKFTMDEVTGLKSVGDLAEAVLRGLN